MSDAADAEKRSHRGARAAAAAVVGEAAASGRGVGALQLPAGSSARRADVLDLHRERHVVASAANL